MGDARHPDFIGLPLSGTEPGGRGKRDFCPPVWLCVRPDSAERTDEGIQGVLPGVSEGVGFSENENDQGLPQWMHVGCRHPDGKQQRGQLLSLVNGRYLPMICFSGDFSLSL